MPAEAERPEDDWVGRTLLVGEAVCVHVVDRAERCVMTAMSLRALGQLNDACFGVYASVRSPGRVRVGDAVHLLTAPG